MSDEGPGYITHTDGCNRPCPGNCQCLCHQAPAGDRCQACGEYLREYEVAQGYTKCGRCAYDAFVKEGF